MMYACVSTATLPLTFPGHRLDYLLVFCSVAPARKDKS